MAEEHVKSLEQARGQLVESRRRCVAQLARGSNPDAWRDEFVNCQSGIEAIDRAIADEAGMLKPTNN